LGTNKPITRINAASLTDQLPTKNIKIPVRLAIFSMMLPTPDPFWGRQHVKVKTQESKSQGKTEVGENCSRKIGERKKQSKKRF
jgi:hypothetical protein